MKWWDVSRSPVIGCSKVNSGCLNCWAEKMAWRLAHHPSPDIHNLYHGTVCDPGGYLDHSTGWNGLTFFNPKALARVPGVGKTIAVNFMGDLFHETALDEWISQTYQWILAHPQHNFVVCTKRPERVPGWFMTENLWRLASISDAASYDSCKVNWDGYHIEPLLGPIDFLIVDNCSWVVVGGETGSNARPCNLNWVRDIRDDCIRAGVPFFFKQGDAVLDGVSWTQTPWKKDNNGSL